MSTLLILDQVRNCDPWSYPNPGFVSLIWNIVGKIFPFFLFAFLYKGFYYKNVKLYEIYLELKPYGSPGKKWLFAGPFSSS